MSMIFLVSVQALARGRYAFYCCGLSWFVLVYLAGYVILQAFVFGNMYIASCTVIKKEWYNTGRPHHVACLFISSAQSFA